MAENEDVGTIQYVAQVVAGAGSVVESRARNLEDVGAAMLCDEVAQRLFEESEQLRHYADRALQIAEENRAKEAGESETISADKLFAVIDLRQVPASKRGEVKWYNPNTTFGDTTGSTRLTYKRGVCFHHAAVKGGFGTHRSRRKLYEETPLGEGWLVQPTKPITREQYQHFMALKHRWIGDPPGQYNNGVAYQVISTLPGVLYFNLPFEWVTWASHGANTGYLSMCFDAHSRYDEYDEHTMFEHVQYTVNEGLKYGHFRQGLEFTIHAAWTNKPCPGRVPTEILVDHIAPKLGADIRWDFKAHDKAQSIREVLAK